MTSAIPRSQFKFNLSAYLISDGPAGFLLSWVAGFVDTSAFIILFGLFTAHVTGNIALAGSSFVSADAETTITRLLMLPTFVLTVALTSLLARFSRHQQWCVFGVLKDFLSPSNVQNYPLRTNIPSAICNWRLSDCPVFSFCFTQ